MTTRSVLAVTVALAGMLTLSGGVLAKDIVCGGGTCEGTKKADHISANSAKDDVVYARGGDDEVNGSSINGGNDTIYGGKGDDTIDVQDGINNGETVDYVDCGEGWDTVYYNSSLNHTFGDTVVNCEVVYPDKGIAPGPDDKSSGQ